MHLLRMNLQLQVCLHAPHYCEWLFHKQLWKAAVKVLFKQLHNIASPGADGADAG
jgi:hypothetical protein